MQFLNTYILLIPRVIWKCWFLFIFILTLIVLYPVFLILLNRNAPYTKAFALMRFWAKYNLLLAGIVVKIKGLDELKKTKGPCIIVANHNSYLDIFVSYAIMPKYFVFIGKHELKHAPLFNIFFKKMNILVDRGSAASGATAYNESIARIKKGESIFIFPEGLINANPNLKPFKNGAFKLAIDTKIPVLAISYCNNNRILQNGGFLKARGTPGVARVIIHQPFFTNDVQEKELLLLKNKVFKTIDSVLPHYEN